MSKPASPKIYLSQAVTRSNEQITVLYQAVLRRDQLLAHERTVLFKELMTDIKQMVSIPESLVFGISDQEIAKHLLFALLAK